MDADSLKLIMWIKENIAYYKLNKYSSKNIIKVSSGTIAKKLKYSPRKIGLVLKALEESGYIRVLEKRPRNTPFGRRTTYIIEVFEWSSH